MPTPHHLYDGREVWAKALVVLQALDDVADELTEGDVLAARQLLHGRDLTNVGNDGPA